VNKLEIVFGHLKRIKLKIHNADDFFMLGQTVLFWYARQTYKMKIQSQKKRWCFI